MRLVICDDHRLFLEALSMALTDQGYTVAEMAVSPDEAVAAALTHQPDACLMDVSFPGASGLSAIGRIHEVSPDTKVVMLSGAITRVLVAQAVTEGAAGFVGKEKPIGVIMEALEMAHRGDLAVDLKLLQDVLRPDPRVNDPLWKLRFLTGREWEVMRCIMDGLSTEQMAIQLGVRPSTARTHVQNLLTKLGVHSRLEAAALMATYASVDTWPGRVR